MDAKLTPEQAIEILKNGYRTSNGINCFSDKEINDITALIESLAADAALGIRLARAVYRRQQIEDQINGDVIPFEEADQYTQPLDDEINSIVKELQGRAKKEAGAGEL